MKNNEQEKSEKICPICERDTPGKYWEKHHLEPRGGKGRGKGAPTEYMCGDCHDFLHMHFSNTDLRKIYNSLDKILEHETVQKWMGWIKKQKFSVCHRKPKKKKGKRRK